MGWAARARVGYLDRLQQRIRLEKLTTRVMPRIIWWQFLHFVVALVLFPFRLIRFAWWRIYAAQERQFTQGH